MDIDATLRCSVATLRHRLRECHNHRETSGEHCAATGGGQRCRQGVRRTSETLLLLTLTCSASGDGLFLMDWGSHDTDAVRKIAGPPSVQKGRICDHIGIAKIDSIVTKHFMLVACSGFTLLENNCILQTVGPGHREVS